MFVQFYDDWSLAFGGRFRETAKGSGDASENLHCEVPKGP